MAYTSVIPVRRLDRAVKYVMNKEKTTAVSLQDALDYAANRDKTEQSCFESSYACTLETAFADMRQTKERWHKLGGVQGYHLVQSFAAGEVTPELAHRIAKELADRVLGGRYEYVIGTHLNTGHIHSHIVWNSVSRIDGKKYHSNGKSYVTEIRAVSDELCRKYKLSVIDTENSMSQSPTPSGWRRKTVSQHGARLFGMMWTKRFNKALHGGSFLTCWSAMAMRCAWGASIPFCVHPEKSALFASKRWASGTRQKPSRRASCIHKATTLMWKIHEQSNMAVCTAGRSLAAS